MDNPIVARGEVLITPSTGADNLAYLGGLPAGGTNRVPDDGCEVYVTLPRPAKLPPPFFNVRKSNKDARVAYMKIWDGNFRIEWFMKGMDKVFAKVSLVEGCGVADRFLGTILHIVFQQFDGDSAILQSGFTSYNAEFSAAFKEEAKHQLAHRVFYHFLRSHGTCLVLQNPSLINSGASLLGNVYKNDAKILLDIMVMRCDIAINHKQTPSFIGRAFTHLGEALEAMGELNKAALLYRHTAETYHTPSRSMSDHAQLQEFSALAYKRDNQLAKAEEGYIRALHFRRRCTCTAGGAWDLNEPRTTLLLTNMLVMIDALHNEKGRRSVKVGDGEVYPVFCALLFTAGFRASRGGVSHGLVQELGRDHSVMLNVEIRNHRGKALAALIEATAHPEKAHFYSVLAKCVPQNTRIEVHSTFERDGAKERLAGIENAQDVFGKNNSAFVLNRCFYVGCPRETLHSVTLKTCPCKTTSYCQKSCQVADWPEHKKVCSWNAKRKKERKAAK